MPFWHVGIVIDFVIFPKYPAALSPAEVGGLKCHVIIFT